MASAVFWKKRIKSMRVLVELWVCEDYRMMVVMVRCVWGLVRVRWDSW